jgi:hypothetical protein
MYPLRAEDVPKLEFEESSYQFAFPPVVTPSEELSTAVDRSARTGPAVKATTQTEIANNNFLMEF